MNQRRLIVGALSASLLLSALPGMALGQEEEAVPYPVEGVQWQLQTLSGEPVPDDVEVTLFLNGGEVVGDAGCNSYFGSYQIDETGLTFPQPFGATRKLCDEPANSIEAAYLPVLQATAGWSVDEEGMFTLTDETGSVTLVYKEPAVEITATDLEALAEELGNLQAQISEASAEITALTEEAAAIDVNRFNRRLNTVEEGLTELQAQVGGVNVVNLRRRVGALEETVERLDRTSSRFSERIAELERVSREQNRRLNQLEQAIPKPEPAQ